MTLKTKRQRAVKTVNLIIKTHSHSVLTNWMAALVALSIILPCAAIAQTTPGPYVVGPEDVVSVSVTRHPEFSGAFYVPPDGAVTLPAAGVVQMSGKTLAQVAESIATNLRARLRSPEVIVTLSSPRKQQIYVMGSVTNPGPFQIQPGWRPPEAITAAGGLSNGVRPEQCRASIRRAATGQSEPIDLAALLRQESPEPGPVLQSGDTLFIEGPELITVYVTGKVAKPGLYQVPKGSATIIEALAIAGGELENAALNRVSITHTSGTSEIHDLTTSAKTGLPGASVKLQPMDMILIPEETAKVAVLGYVGEPGFFPLKSTETLTLIDAISQARGTIAKAKTSSVAIIRNENGKQQRLMYDINRFLRSGDLTQNPPLRPGDVVFVSGSTKPDWNEMLGSAAAVALIINPFL